jgi:hypothetical protein
MRRNMWPSRRKSVKDLIEDGVTDLPGSGMLYQRSAQTIRFAS